MLATSCVRHPLRSPALARAFGIAGALMLLPALATAQAHTPEPHDAPAPATAAALPTRPGQDAYGAIAEIVRLLEADPGTDWTRVNLERLRQHLIDMNEITLRAVVRQRAAPGGLELDVTGTGPTEAAIRRMVSSHARQLGAHGMAARSADILGGVQLTVTATDSSDEALVGKIRGLGFIGIMTLGDHHAAHHLAMARGGPVTGHDH